MVQIGDAKVAKGKGPTYGNDLRSFRVEGYEMASVLVYLQLLQHLTDFAQDCRSTNILICDNQGLLTRIEEATQWK
jgi:hypothetical protein